MDGDGVDMTSWKRLSSTAAADYGARRGISYVAWREAGVPPSVLRRARQEEPFRVFAAMAGRCGAGFATSPCLSHSPAEVAGRAAVAGRLGRGQQVLGRDRPVGRLHLLGDDVAATSGVLGTWRRWRRSRLPPRTARLLPSVPPAQKEATTFIAPSRSMESLPECVMPAGSHRHVSAQGALAVDQVLEVGTFVGHQWGLSHGHGQPATSMIVRGATAAQACLTGVQARRWRARPLVGETIAEVARDLDVSEPALRSGSARPTSTRAAGTS